MCYVRLPSDPMHLGSIPLDLPEHLSQAVFERILQERLSTFANEDKNRWPFGLIYLTK